MTDQKIKTEISKLSNDVMSIEMFMIMSTAHKNYPFENKQDLIDAFTTFITPTER